MVFFTDKEIDDIIIEDVPYGDLTTVLLSIGNVSGSISFITREKTVVCGTEEASRIFTKLGIKLERYVSSGTVVAAGSEILTGRGNGNQLHIAWRNCSRLLEQVSGIATRTRALVDAAKCVAPHIEVAATRKCFPGTKKLAVKAVLAGGAVMHRLGLSETVLVFNEHMRMMGGIENFAQKLHSIRKRTPEKKIVAEAHTVADATVLLSSGVDVIQCDKFSTSELSEIVDFARTFREKRIVAAAGNVNITNVSEIVSIGVDLIVTSSMYYGKPSDIQVKLIPEKQHSLS